MKRPLPAIRATALLLLSIAPSCHRGTPRLPADQHATVASATTSEPPTAAPTTQPGRGMASAEGVTLSVLLPPTNPIGSPIFAEVVLRNASGVTIEYRDKRPEDHVFHVQAVDAQGRRVSPIPRPLSAGPGTLRTGETLRRKIDLTPRMRLPGPGEYLLTVSALFRVDGRVILLHVNRVPFRVEGE